MEMLCYVRTECDPIHAAFRSVSPHVQECNNTRYMQNWLNETFLYISTLVVAILW